MSARDLLLQVKALPPAEQRRFLDAMMDLDAATHLPAAEMQVPDFEAYWGRLHSLGMPRWTAEQTAGLDRWLAGEDAAA
ncbi:hypothetical protein [Prosthecobacter fluviatilis]|uniref:Uncharacterized protein n=1 Tax=Prosthecobacter fluviatilis TaxID=445931 RepID=A0ABW0KUU1_9BACT